MHPERQPRPATPFYICLYINYLVLEGCKHGTLTSASSGIRWGHVTLGFSNPMDNMLVRTVLEGAKRIIGKPKGENQKEPMSTEMIKEVVRQFGESPDLTHRRLVVVCLLGFSFFFADQ